MAFVGNPVLICDDEPEFVERAEYTGDDFKAGELVYTQRATHVGYLAAVADHEDATTKILGQVQTDATGVTGARHKVQLITPETDIEIVASGITAVANEGQIYGNAVASNVHTLDLSDTTYPVFYVKRSLRTNPDRVSGAFVAKAVVRVLAVALEGLV
jgi:hypothetical protein